MTLKQKPHNIESRSRSKNNNDDDDLSLRFIFEQVALIAPTLAWVLQVIKLRLPRNDFLPRDC